VVVVVVIVVVVVVVVVVVKVTVKEAHKIINLVSITINMLTLPVLCKPGSQ